MENNISGRVMMNFCAIFRNISGKQCDGKDEAEVTKNGLSRIIG